MTITDTLKDAAQSVGIGNGASGESKSARKKKAKTETISANNGTPSDLTALPRPSSQENSAADHNSTEQDPVLVELQKKIRNTNKKLQGMTKVDSILKENPGVSLDDLVAQRKINQDQKAQAQKKPELEAQRAAFQAQIEEHRAREAKTQAKLAKQHDELTAKHEQEISKLREELSLAGVTSAQMELREKLLTFSQFLRAAAAKRAAEGEEDSEESRAFEGALLLVYGGDDKAVDAAVSIIDGSQEKVPSIDGIPTEISYAQVKQAAIKHAPFQIEEEWLDGVEKANASDTAAPAGSDPTITHAGLTELEAPNGAAVDTQPEPAPVQGTSGEGGNIAGERWDTDAAGTSAGAEKSGLEESYEIIPRPNEEVDVPVSVSTQPQQQGTSWAEESHEAATGNKAGENWDTTAPGETNGSWGAEPVASANGWGDAPAPAPAAVADDGFSQVAGRRGGRGSGGGRGRGNGEFRGRGGRGGGYRGRGDGENRGRGRGGFRGHRGEGGEFRGRGRGPRGGAPAAAAASS